MFHPKDELRGKYIKALDRQLSAYIGEKNYRLTGDESNARKSNLLNQEVALIVSSGIVITLIFALILTS